MRYSTKQSLLNWSAFAYLILISVPIVFFFFWMIRTAILPAEVLNNTPIQYFPRLGQITLRNYAYLFIKVPFWRWFLNSSILAIMTIVVGITVSAIAAYSFSRFAFKGKSQLMLIILFFTTVPQISLAIPYYMVLKSIGLLNTYAGVGIAYISFTFPFATWMLTSYFISIPRELDEAALVDGCGRMRAFVKVVFPLAIPGVIATAIFCFIVAWTNFLMGLMLTTEEVMQPLTVGLAGFIAEFKCEWGLLMAGSTLAVLPIIPFVFAQKYLISGLTAGAIKG